MSAAALAVAGITPIVSRAIARPPRHHQVEIKEFEFVPAILVARPGDTITWTNRDITPHTATALDKSWDTGLLRTGQSAMVTVGTHMTNSYYCRFHPMMKAALRIVADP